MAPVRADVDRAGVVRDASKIRSYALLQDPVRYTLLAESGRHFRQYAAGPVTEIPFSHINGSIQVIDPCY